MRKIYLKIKNLEFTIQAKGVFIITFLFSTLLFLLMSATLNFSIGFMVFEFCCYYVFFVGSLNIIVGLYELYEAFTNKDNFNIHFNSFLLIFSNIIIGIIYTLIVFLFDKP